MAVVISNESLEQHNVNKYNFKVLATGSNKLEEQKSTSSTPSATTQVSQASKVQESFTEEMSIDSSEISQDSRNALIESLMKKTEEMTSNFIKLQMKLEAKEEEHKIELKRVEEEAFARGMEAQAKQMQEDEVNNKNNAITQFSNSVITLNSAAAEFNSALEGIKSELMVAALDIAKEVVQVELKKNSNEVAQALASNLIAELQSASKITLKVNPLNHGAVSQRVGTLEHINVVSDGAISEGGVIVMSDAGNIDAQVSKRFEQVKRAVLSE